MPFSGETSHQLAVIVTPASLKVFRRPSPAVFRAKGGTRMELSLQAAYVMRVKTTHRRRNLSCVSLSFGLKLANAVTSEKPDDKTQRIPRAKRKHSRRAFSPRKGPARGR